MSWDAYLEDIDGHCFGDWNYTHNTNGMIAEALRQTFSPLQEGESWWKRLNGMSGHEGANYLGVIIAELESSPDRYLTMNPPNEWGNYEGLLKTLRDMKARVPTYDAPTTWRVIG